MNPEEVLNLAREEARAVSHQRLQRSLPSADAHTTARARREYINTQRGISARVIESIQENNMTDQTSNQEHSDQEHSDQEQEQHPTDRYPFPAHWPITGPFANTDQE